MPGWSRSSIQRWLPRPKNVSVSRPCPSVTTASKIEPGRLRIRRVLTEATSASTVTWSPSRSPSRLVSSPRLAYRRG